jgi:hypothetical protein
MNLQYVNLFTFVHFLFYFMVGILFPNRFGTIVIVSLLWELVEGYAVQHRVLYSLLQQYWLIPEKYWNEGIVNKVTDIIANLAGYSIVSYSAFISKYKSQAFCIALILWISIITYSSSSFIL